MNISEKAADELSNLITNSQKYTVVNRDKSTSAVLASEKDRSLDAESDAKSGPKLRNEKVADFLITGTIDAFTAVQSTESKTGTFGGSQKTVTGKVNLTVTLTVTSLETTDVVGSVTATAEKTGEISAAKSNPGGARTIRIPGMNINASLPNTSNGKSTDSAQTILKLVDDDIQDVAQQLIDKVQRNNMLAPPARPKLLAIVDGSVVINKGLNSGIETGRVFEVQRTVSEAVDPDTQQVVKIRKKICTLTIASVDDTTSQGKCSGGTPAMGDELKVVSK